MDRRGSEKQQKSESPQSLRTSFSCKPCPRCHLGRTHCEGGPCAAASAKRPDMSESTMSTRRFICRPSRWYVNRLAGHADGHDRQ